MGNKRINRFMAILLSLCMVLSIGPVSVFAEGSGTETDPIQITTQEELEAITGSNHYILMNNIALEGTWTPCSNFSGTLDGNGKTITGLNVVSTDNRAGMFSSISSSGVIKNLTLYGTVSTSFSSNAGRVGGFAAVNNGTISGCTFYGIVAQPQGDNQAVGGIAGLNEAGGAITDCKNYGDITGVSTGGSYNAVYVGGIAGSNHGSIDDCYNEGTIYAAASNANVYTGVLWGSTSWKAHGAYAGGIAGDTSSAASNNTSVGTVVGENSQNQLELTSIVQPSSISLSSGISADELNALLPTAVLLNTESGTTSVGSVVWDISTYDSSIEDETYLFTGTVTLPANVQNTASVPLTTTITVIVGDGAQLPESSHTAHCICGGDVTTGSHVCSGENQWTAWDSADAMPTESGSYYLTTEVAINSPWIISAGVEINLCLNGKSLKYSGTTKNDGVICVEGGTLNICDCSGGGKITGGNGSSSGAGGIYIESGAAALYSGSISGNEASAYGAGVRIGDRKTDGTGSTGNFTMYGGQVSENTVTSSAGGGGGVYVMNGSFIMHGGTICNNTGGFGGGGVYVYNGSFSMNGGSITGNQSSERGGGVIIPSDFSLVNSITISGTSVITGNTVNGAANNLYLSQGKTITATALTEGANIGVSTFKTPAEGSPVAITGRNDADYAKYFASDCEDYVIENSGGNVVRLAVPHIHEYTEKKADEGYLKTPADCENPAVYYTSCPYCGQSSQGTSDEGTFTSGSAQGHAYGSWNTNGNGTHTRICTRNASHTETENCTGGTASYFSRKICTICNGEYGDPLTDTSRPAAEISIKDNKWNSLLNKITFGLFFKETQEVTITGTDDSYNHNGYTADKAVKIAYYLHNGSEALTEEELKAAVFTDYSRSFNLDPDNQYIIYARVTDHAGNVRYVSSEGIILDATAPVINGIEDGKTYCTEASFTVDEAYIDTVKSGETVLTADEKDIYTLTAGTHTVVATDQAGNETKATVTVNAGHTPEADDGDCTTQLKCTVCGTVVKAAQTHSFTKYVSDGNAGCTNDGTKTAKCDHEGCTKTDTVEDTGSALGHSYGAPQWTWSEDGQYAAATFICQRNGCLDTENGHTVTENATVISEVKTGATCTEQGETTYTAKVTFNKQEYTATKDVVDIPALKHDMGSWRTIISPSCTDKGAEKRSCSRCGYAETRGLNPNGHQWEESFTVDKAATCTEDGSKSIHCKNCSAVKESTVIPAFGHQFVNGVCSICGEADPNYSAHEATDGSDSSWNKGDDRGASIGVPTEIGDVNHVIVDGKELTEDRDYTVENGRVVIHPDILEKLGEGKHTVVIHGENGYVKTVVTVKKKAETAPGYSGMGTNSDTDADTDNPKTGDSTNPALWFVLMLTSVGGLGAALRNKRKRREAER